MDAAVAFNSTRAMVAVLQALTAAQITYPLWPPNPSVQNNDTFDFIIAGGGTAGCILANRLTEVADFNVLLIEAGGDPPIESVLGGMFTYLQNTQYTWNFTYDKADDAKYHRNEVIEMPQGRLLGGSANIGHLLYMRGGPYDYEPWAEASLDDSWGWDGIYPYLLKAERMTDKEILASGSKTYGTNGPVSITREAHNKTAPILQALAEQGNNIVLNINDNGTLGYGQAVFSNDFFRQGGSNSYLTPVKDRSNLKVLRNTLVTKILFDGTTAIGVEALTSNNDIVNLYASKEVIVTAGAFNTPKLLMLSGIGPREHLQSLNIEVLSDLPVGKNLQDQVCTVLIHKLDKSDTPAEPLDVTKFPAATIIGLRSINSSQNYPDYQVINFQIPSESVALLGVSQIVFAYNDDVCQKMYEAEIGRNLLFSILNIVNTKSRGTVLLQSTDPKDLPLVTLGGFTEESDLESTVDCIEDFMTIENSEYFKKIDAEFVDLDLEECNAYEFGSRDYWRAYVKSTFSSMFNYAGTCSLGSVVDSRLRVNGVSRLRVADASVMPTDTIGKILAPVLAIFVFADSKNIRFQTLFYGCIFVLKIKLLALIKKYFIQTSLNVVMYVFDSVTTRCENFLDTTDLRHQFYFFV